MFVCKFCGKILEDDSRFCNGCGSMVTDPAKASDDTPTMPLTAYDENLTLDSLIEDIDTLSVDEDGDVVTVPFTEEDSEKLTMPLDYNVSDENEDDITVPLESYDKEDDVQFSETEDDIALNKAVKTRKTFVIAIIIIVFVLLFASLIAIETNLIFPTYQQDAELNISVETAREEIKDALWLDSIDAVREVYNRYVPEYYDDSEPLTEEAQVVVDELIAFYDDVYREIENQEFPVYEDPDDFLRQEWGDIVVDSYGGVQTIWEHGEAYAPDELVSRRKAVEDLCYQIEWR